MASHPTTDGLVGSLLCVSVPPAQRVVERFFYFIPEARRGGLCVSMMEAFQGSYFFAFGVTRIASLR